MKTNNVSGETTYSWRFSYGYGFGEFGFTFFLFFISYYLMYYMTDVLCLPMGTAAFIYTLVQWFEGITMVGAGILVDRVRIPGGRYRPWMLLGAVLCAVSTVIFFWNFHLSDLGNTLVFTIFYFLAYCGYNIMWVGYRSLAGKIARTESDNIALTMSSAQLGCVAGILFSFCGSAILHHFVEIQTGYLVSALLCGAAMIAGCSISAAVTADHDRGKPVKKGASPSAEKNVPETENAGVDTTTRSAGDIPECIEPADKEQAVSSTENRHVRVSRTSWREFTRILDRNMIAFFFSVSFREAIQTLLPTLLIYYFQYAAGDSGWMSVYLAVITLVSLFGNFLARYSAQRFGKKNMYILSSFISAACIMAINVIHANMILFMILIAVHSLCSIFSGSMIPAFMNEIADYDEKTREIHMRGFIVSLGGVAIRVAAILGGGIAAIGLAALGYQKGMAGSPAFVRNLTLLMTAGSAGGLALGAFVMFFYRLESRKGGLLASSTAEETE